MFALLTAHWPSPVFGLAARVAENQLEKWKRQREIGSNVSHCYFKMKTKKKQRIPLLEVKEPGCKKIFLVAHSFWRKRWSNCSKVCLYLSTEQTNSRKENLGVWSGSSPCTAHQPKISDKRKWLTAAWKLKTLQAFQIRAVILRKEQKDDDRLLLPMFFFHFIITHSGRRSNPKISAVVQYGR